MAINFLRPRLRALVGAFAAGLLAASMSPAAPAMADVSTVPASTVSATGKAVYDMVVLPSGRTILGGNFTALGAFARSNLGAVLADGTADPTFAPTTDGTVYALSLIHI